MPRRISATPARRLASELISSPVFTGDADAAAARDRFSPELASWLVAEPGFRAFADAHRDKIRRKLRLARDAGALLDVRAELLVARQLLGNRNVELAFEPGGSLRGGPDFAVTYRGGRPFNLEVTRPRSRAGDVAARALLSKLRQLPSGSPNVLVLVLLRGEEAPEVASAVRDIRARADAGDDAFFNRRRFVGTRDFHDRFLRLGAVVTWPEDGAPAAWVNRSARVPLPDRTLRACLQALGPAASPHALHDEVY